MRQTTPNTKNAGFSLRRTPDFLGMPDSGRRQPEHLAARGTPLMFPQRGYRHWLWPRLNAPDGAGCSLSAQFPNYAHKGRNYATQHRTQRLDSALVCKQRCLIRGPCVRTSGQKEAPGALTTRPHAAPSRCRSASAPCHLGKGPRPAPLEQGRKCTWWCWVLPDTTSASPAPKRAHSCLNAPDGAGRSLTGGG